MSRNSRILIVEDQSLVAETIATALGDEYEVVCRASAGEALAILDQGRSELVLLDCLLPGGHAADVVARADAAQVPVILMSGDPDRMEQLRDGDRPFLPKPFSLDALMHAVRTALPLH